MDKIGQKRPLKWFLREWRKHKSLTLDQVAERVDTNRGQVSKLERGELRMNDDWIAKFAFAFAIEPADLLRDPAAPTRDELLRNATPEQAQQIRDFADYVLSRKTA